jgi:2-dehydro-3-deoxyphosphogluconate aldolase / (4S)-4-hydroxy-2-oxoglutarate aldolase
MTTPDVDAFFARQLEPARVMAILRGYGPARTLELCRQAWSLGIALVEIPVQNEQDLVSLQEAVVAGAESGALVGAGTVTSPALVDRVAGAGAAFTVAPGLDEDVAKASRDALLPHLPGVATASEIHRALGLGLTWLKAFPAVSLGPAWFTAMRGPFPQVRLVATGGVDPANAAAFLEAGAAAVSLGRAFADAEPERVRGLASS